MLNIIETASNFLSDMDFLKLPVDPFELAKKYDIIISEVDTEKFDGCIQSYDNNFLITISSNIKDINRRNFTCAHELGHYNYDMDFINNSSKIECSQDVIHYLKEKQSNWDAKELRANKFASEILMPTKLIKPFIVNNEPSWSLFNKLKNICNVSLVAIITKFIEITNHSCWFIEIKNGSINRFVKSNNSPSNLRIVTNIRYRLNTSQSWEECSPFEFFDDYTIPHSAKRKKILYTSYEINAYNMKYVILWDENGIFDEDEEDEDEEITFF